MGDGWGSRPCTHLPGAHRAAPPGPACWHQLCSPGPLPSPGSGSWVQPSCPAPEVDRAPFYIRASRGAGLPRDGVAGAAGSWIHTGCVYAAWSLERLLGAGLPKPPPPPPSPSLAVAPPALYLPGPLPASFWPRGSLPAHFSTPVLTSLPSPAAITANQIPEWLGSY